jgi:hypothetical protein
MDRLVSHRETYVLQSCLILTFSALLLQSARSQTAIPSPPPSAGGATMNDTVRFINDQQLAAGAVMTHFTESGDIDNSGTNGLHWGKAWLADACTLVVEYKNHQEDRDYMQFAQSITDLSAIDPRNVRVELEPEWEKREGLKNGKNVLMVDDPPLYIVTFGDAEDYHFSSLDQDQAVNVAKAYIHAVALCRSGSQAGMPVPPSGPSLAQTLDYVNSRITGGKIYVSNNLLVIDATFHYKDYNLHDYDKQEEDKIPVKDLSDLEIRSQDGSDGGSYVRLDCSRGNPDCMDAHTMDPHAHNKDFRDKQEKTGAVLIGPFADSSEDERMVNAVRHLLGLLNLQYEMQKRSHGADDPFK